MKKKSKRMYQFSRDQKNQRLVCGFDCGRGMKIYSSVRHTVESGNY